MHWNEMKKRYLKFLIVHALCGWEWTFFFFCFPSFHMFYLLHNEINEKGCISISFFDLPVRIGGYWNIPVKALDSPPSTSHPLQSLSSKLEH